jgi:hypothetical protein
MRLMDKAGKAISGARISMEADMSHPGMAPVFADVRETAPGSYQGPIGFTMAGDWVLLLHVTMPDGQKIERQCDVRGVRPRQVPD